MSVHLFGVRHHGPGCARALRAALQALKPDILLVEGPPDAQAALPLLASKKMQPPVALLIYVPDVPQRAVFYPFTTFSPEWQALSYALGRGIPARFMDLPQAIQLAREPAIAEETSDRPGSPTVPDLPAAADSVRPHAAAAEQPNERGTAVAVAEPAAPPDPMSLLAQAAGYDDHELWWEREIEQRRDATDLFEAIFEAMDALRAGTAPRDDEEAQREAHMRTYIRAAEAEGYQRIAVVSGAWHSPALARRDDPRADAATLKGLQSVKVEATWIPWTNSRLSYRSGYGAGISSPGWYGHLWSAPDRVPTRWAAQAAQLLRSEGLDASSASVIETVRLGEALAAMRGLPMPGMAEMHEAIQTVLCHGETSPMTLIRERLEIGEALGSVPPETPAVPLQRDLDAQRRRVHLTPVDVEKLLRNRNLDLSAALPVALDLRSDTDRIRSQLFHRLRLLGIEWAKPSHSGHGALGTFHEDWQLKWEPEFAVALIEANVWGNTIARASAYYARHLADEAHDLPELSELLEKVILAELLEATGHLLARIEARAAVAADVRHLMDALPPLASVARYGNVRGAQAGRVTPVIDTLFTRALIGLPGACASLDDDAAAEMTASIEHVHETVGLLNRDDQRAAWIATLRGLVTRDAMHGLLRGRAARLLLDMQALDGDELRRLAGLALSPAVPADQAAAWIEGALRGGGRALLLQDGLWRALDAWLAELPAETFVALLPLLRRAFAGFSAPERRSMGEKVKRLGDSETASASPATRGAGVHIPLSHERAAAVLPVLAQILGVDHHAD